MQVHSEVRAVERDTLDRLGADLFFIAAPAGLCRVNDIFCCATESGPRNI